MNACDNTCGFSWELVLLAISFIAEDLRLFCTGLCQEGVTSPDSVESIESICPDVRAKFHAPFSRWLEPAMFRRLFGEI